MRSDSPDAYQSARSAYPDSMETLVLRLRRVRTAAGRSLGCGAEVTAQELEHVSFPYTGTFVREHAMSGRCRRAPSRRRKRLVDDEPVWYPALLEDVGKGGDGSRRAVVLGHQQQHRGCRVVGGG